MPDATHNAIEYAHDHRQQFLDELKDLVRIPSVSNNPDHKADIQQAADWLAGHLKSLGIDNVQIFPTAGHPIIFGEYLQAGKAAPTVLIYGHYDVQPAEPLELWESPAFEPAVRGENLYGRGVSDMKGQVVATLAAIEAIVRTGQMPVNLKFIFEGEEEIGSPHMDEFIASHKELLNADFALNPDTGMIAPDLPTITFALRGLAYFELHITGPDHDLHSGTFGGVVHNPALALCELLAGMHDEQGRITLPGFYDSVRNLTEAERSELARGPIDREYFLEATGAPALKGEAGYLPIEQATARPTLDVNGILSGYTGPGGKTVIPSQAMAKISMRLVPDQDPKQVEEQLIEYMKDHAPETICWEVIDLQGGPPSISDLSSSAIKAMSQALETVWGRRPLFRREGGSVPVVADFQRLLNIETVNTGFGLSTDNAHSPNEKLHMPTWYRGIDALIYFFNGLVENERNDQTP